MQQSRQAMWQTHQRACPFTVSEHSLRHLHSSVWPSDAQQLAHMAQLVQCTRVHPPAAAHAARCCPLAISAAAALSNCNAADTNALTIDAATHLLPQTQRHAPCTAGGQRCTHRRCAHQVYWAGQGRTAATPFQMTLNSCKPPAPHCSHQTNPATAVPAIAIAGSR